MQTTHDIDCIIVGSGICGVHAAYPLVERGLRVAMLDVGIIGETEKRDERTFEDIRRTEPEQYKIFLGNDFSGIDLGGDHARAMVSGRRSHVASGGDIYAPIEQGTTQVLQSFARGGLSEAWSGACEFFESEELQAAGLPDLKTHYQTIIDRIGVSGKREGYRLQPAPNIDETFSSLFARYKAREERVRLAGFSLEQPMYAMLTQDLDGRSAQTYRDMDFWDNSCRTLYRASFTLEKLRTHENFTYIPGHLVLAVSDKKDGVTVVTRTIETGATKEFAAHRLVMAAGAINTTRILLRSFAVSNPSAPILMKNNYNVPLLFPAMLGQAPQPRRHSFVQLAIKGHTRRNGMGDAYAQLIPYNSLLLNKLLRYVPLPIPEAFSMLSMLAPSIIIADIRFPSTMEKEHRVVLRTNGDRDALEIEYPEKTGERAAQESTVSQVKKVLRSFGLFPLTTVRNPYGATSHYAGGVPIEETPTSALSADSTCHLHGHEGIFIADAATWRALPAKPSGLTMMANANRVGEEVARHF